MRAVISKPEQIKTKYISDASKINHCQQPLLTSTASFNPNFLVCHFNIFNTLSYLTNWVNTYLTVLSSPITFLIDSTGFAETR